MGSGQWTVEKRSSFRNDSLTREYEQVTETGCLSIIVLGASGDLAKKKTFPALYNLYRQVPKPVIKILCGCLICFVFALCIINDVEEEGSMFVHISGIVGYLEEF